ncbi:hypothetical protein EDD22DRAFT_980656 [Suillus occidentalis]|nr:hypothetical protein EDD22DRAFT_980656 [Suillus occidentalis]
MIFIQTAAGNIMMKLGHHTVDSKFGRGGVSGASERRKILRKLALETAKVQSSNLARTQGKNHLTNRCQGHTADDASTQSNLHKVFLKIGRSDYRVTKVQDKDIGKEGMMVQVHLPQIKVDPPNKAYQYLIVAAGPYETVAFRIFAREIEDEADDAGHWNWSYWELDTKQYSFQLMFRLIY